MVRNAKSSIQLYNDTNLELTQALNQDEWLMTEFLNDKNPYFRIPSLKADLTNNLIIKTNKNNKIQRRIENTDHWETLYTPYINQTGDYRIMKNNDILPKPKVNLTNYPNPFNPDTNITFSLFNDLTKVTLEIFDIRGQKVKTVYNGFLFKGDHKFTWNGTNQQDKTVASGVYFVRLNANNENSSRKILLLK
jgi:hypothetical protein